MHAHLCAKIYRSVHVVSIHSIMVKNLDSEFRRLAFKSCLPSDWACRFGQVSWLCCASIPSSVNWGWKCASEGTQIKTHEQSNSANKQSLTPCRVPPLPSSSSGHSPSLLARLDLSQCPVHHPCSARLLAALPLCLNCKVSENMDYVSHLGISRTSINAC